MNKGQIVSNILNILQNNKEIFDGSSQYLLFKSPNPIPITEGNFTGYAFDFPFNVPRDTANGYKLKNDKGFIAMREVYAMNNSRKFTKVSHVYKYITEEYTYLCDSKSYGKKEFMYNFHYDMDLLYKSTNEIDSHYHPPIHLQVLHSHPRFPIQDDSFELFIEQVKLTCFKPNLDPFESALYAIT